MDTYREPGVHHAQPMVPHILQARAPRTLSLRVRLIVLVAGTMLPLLLVIAIVVLGSYMTTRRQAEQRVLLMTRGVPPE